MSLNEFYYEHYFHTCIYVIFGLVTLFRGCVDYTPLHYDDFEGSRDTTAKDDDFTFIDERTISPWGFNSTSRRVTFMGNVLKTTHVVGRKKDFRMMLVVGLVPNFMYYKVKDLLRSPFNFGQHFLPLCRDVIVSCKLFSCHAKLYITLTFILKRNLWYILRIKFMTYV